MNTVEMILNGYKKIFSGSNALLNNIILFVLTGIIAITTLYFESIKNATIAIFDINIFTFLSAIILTVLVSVYIGGYTYKFIHQAFSETENCLLPDFDLKPIGAFFKALPLVIVWIVYLAAILIIAGILITFAPILGGVLAIIFVLMAVFTTFVFITYCENFEFQGLFNITLPFRYMAKTLPTVVILGLLFIVVGMISLILCGLSGIACAILGFTDPKILSLVGGILGSYFGCLAQFVWYYCLVQVYKEKIQKQQL